ncbi:hypothetical protein [Streptomyces sp. NPDC020917]|uniref:hypothetical protein n=1 Tax=Streptomyces sp. NPDC020917 TaxID=3365102 RepID=UPI003787C229
MRDGGALFSTAFGGGDGLLADPRIRGANHRLDRKPERLAELAESVTTGVLSPVVGAYVPLTEAPRTLAGGTEGAGPRGKRVLRVP